MSSNRNIMPCLIVAMTVIMVQPTWAAVQRAKREVIAPEKIDTSASDLLWHTNFSIGGKEFFLLFEDTSLLKDFKSVIAKDLTMMHSTFYIANTRHLPISFAFYLNNKELTATDFIDFASQKGDFRPQLITQMFGYVVKLDSKQILVVPKSISDAYVKNIFGDKRLTRAYDLLPNFLAQANAISKSMKLGKIELNQIIFFPDPNERTKLSTISEDKKTEIISTLFSDYIFESPSLLDLKLSTYKELGLGNSSDVRILCKIYPLNKKTGKASGSYLPLIFDSDVWKILIIDY